LAERPWLREKVHWLGQSGDIPGLLKTANILVHPSRWEGMPNAVLEAMAAGLPVVGTTVEGTEELVIPGQTGWLVPANDPEALSQALIAATDSRDCCYQFGRAGRQLVEREFSIQTTVNAYEQLWAGILGLQLCDLQ
jgi:starch synthase (maltosyl-transferring)